MDINNRTVCFVIALNCPYGGNIIPSLKTLAKKLRDDYTCRVCWVFPAQEKRAWLEALKAEFPVEFTRSAYAQTATELLRLFDKWEVDLVHTHYDAYDVPCSKIFHKTQKAFRLIWHIHNHMTYDTDWLRKIKRKITYAKRYHWYGRHASYIAVSAEMAAFTGYYRKHAWGIPPHYSNEALKELKFPEISVLLNGIDLSRIKMLTHEPLNDLADNIFLSYGGYNVHKRIDLLIQAGRQLAKKGFRFKIRITNGVDTEKVVGREFGNKLPEWFELIPQENDISVLLSQASCYVSTSIHETMSTAIAEATLYGIPVIQSDIPGTWWNADNPSTFVFKNLDVDDLVHQMEKVMTMDKEQMIQACRQTRQTNLECLDLNRWCNEIITTYKQKK